MFHKIIEKSEFSAGIIITFQVMAFARMSPGHPDTVSPLHEGRKKKLGAHTPGAWYSDDPDVRRILHPSDTRKVSGSVAAPVA